MTSSPLCFRALAVTSAAVCLTALSTATAQSVDPATPQAQSAPVVASSPAPTDEKLAADLVADSAKERHLAPHDTFYLLSYVAVKTKDGVEGFDPGQEVHLVEVHRPTQTLVVTDGHAQVEVPPSQLTNDMDIAALVRQKDEASQAKIVAHRQAEQTAYDKYERAAADATARDLANRRRAQQAQADELRAQEQAPVAETAPPANASVNNGSDGFYGYGGYGYGSPYSYFSGPSVVVGQGSSAPAAAASGSRGVNPATVGTAGRAVGHR